MVRHAQITQNNKFAVCLQYLRKEVSDDVDFGRNFQNIESLRGVRNRLLERADNPENWRLLWKWGLSLFLLLYSSITLCVWEM